MRYRPAEGEWSIKETIGHLRDYAEIWSKRFHMIWSQTDPLFINHDEQASVQDDVSEHGSQSGEGPAHESS
jgi:hypothetical protein